MKQQTHCPHGQNTHKCKTCTHARDYWAKFDWEAYYKQHRPTQTATYLNAIRARGE
jgi:hypothetical protein